MSKKSFYIKKKKKINPYRINRGLEHGRRFIVLGNQYGERDVM